MPYTVMVGDNARDETQRERYTLGEFGTFEDAIAACKRIVDDYLLSTYKPGMTADKLAESYKNFGEDPWIVDYGGSAFSARDYAEQRCKEICEE